MESNKNRRKIFILAGAAGVFVLVVALGLVFGGKPPDESNNSSTNTFGNTEAATVQLNSEDGRVLSMEYPKELKIDTQQTYREEAGNYGGLVVFDSAGGNESETAIDYNISLKVTSAERPGAISEDLLYELVGDEDLQDPSIEDFTAGDFTGQLASSEYVVVDSGDEYYVSTALLTNENGRYIEFSAIYKKTSSLTPAAIKALLSSIEID